MWPRYKQAVKSGEYNPTKGRTDVDQLVDEASDANVDLTRPSKGAVKSVLKKPSECEKLRTAAAKAGCAEMVDYCKECLEYEKLFSDADRLNKAQAIVSKYLTQGCDTPVNIPDTQLKAIEKIADQPTPTIFKTSFEECVKLISDNVYAGYLALLREEAEAAKAMPASAAAAPRPGGGGCCSIS